MMDGILKPVSEAPVLGHRARWLFDPLGPLVLLVTVLCTITISVYAFVILPRDSTTPAVYLLEDPVSDLVRVSEVDRQMTQAGQGLPGWLQEWSVETPQSAREDAEQRWEELPTHITDEVLHQFVTIGTYDEIADKLIDRFP